MKRAWIWILVWILVASAAAAEERPGIILLTVYQQMGWGDRIDVGCVDEEGGLWTMTGSASAIGWPAGIGAQLDFLRGAAPLRKAGELGAEDLFDLKGLVACTEAQEVRVSPVANDAGTEISYAVRYDDAREVVRLGMSGDDVYENTDPDAQALYALLRRLFPGVTCYDDLMGPAGFQPVPVAEFLGLDRDAIRDATIREYLVDCEIGSIPVKSVDEGIREIVLNGMVTGKVNATILTGGTTAFEFYDDRDDCLGGLEMYEGLLVTSDGMYRVE